MRMQNKRKVVKGALYATKLSIRWRVECKFKRNIIPHLTGIWDLIHLSIKLKGEWKNSNQPSHAACRSLYTYIYYIIFLSIPNSNMFPNKPSNGVAFLKIHSNLFWPLWRTCFCIKALQLFTTYIFIFFSSLMMATQKESSKTLYFVSFTCTW